MGIRTAKKCVVEDKEGISKSKDWISEGKDKVSELEDTISVLKYRDSEVECLISDQKDFISEIEESISANEWTISEMKDTISVVQNTVSVVEDTISEVKDAISEVNDAISPTRLPPGGVAFRLRQPSLTWRSSVLVFRNGRNGSEEGYRNSRIHGGPFSGAPPLAITFLVSPSLRRAVPSRIRERHRGDRRRSRGRASVILLSRAGR